MAVNHIVIHFLEALLSILRLAEGDVAVAKTLAGLPVQDYLRLNDRVPLALEHLVKVQVIERLTRKITNMNTWPKVLRGLLIIIRSPASSIVELQVLEALNELVSICICK